MSAMKLLSPRIIQIVAEAEQEHEICGVGHRHG
jgi:hypothetical protein